MATNTAPNANKRNSLEAADQQSLLHPFTSITDILANGPRVMVEAQGMRIRDSRGREYLDAMAGLWCVNVGYGRRELVDAMAEQGRKLSYFHAFNAMSIDTSVRCAERLLALAPDNMSKVFFGCSGSDANESQIKLIWLYNNLRGKPNKKKIIARTNAYHGSAVASASLTGIASMHELFDLPIDRFLHVSRPLYYRDAEEGQSEQEFSASLAAELDQRIESEGSDTVAAFFAEPVMGAGGLIPTPAGYFEAVQPVLKKHDVLLVADEVVTGFGRLGTYWGSDKVGMQPDLMTLAKGMTSGYFPMSGCLISDEVWDVFKNAPPEKSYLGHGYTYSAHPMGAAVAMANLDVIESEQLVENAAQRGEQLHRELHRRLDDHPLVGNIRGLGLLAGIELVKDKSTKEPFPARRGVGKKLYQRLLDQGLISRALGDVLVFSPALVARAADIDEIVEQVECGLNALAAELGR